MDFTERRMWAVHRALELYQSGYGSGEVELDEVLEVAEKFDDFVEVNRGTPNLDNTASMSVS